MALGVSPIDSLMKRIYQTEQEDFWAGEFGDEYLTRNRGNNLLAGRLALLARVFSKIEPISTLIEFGANIGLNLHAARLLLPSISLSALDINSTAVKGLSAVGGIEVLHGSILDFAPKRLWDFVLVSGLLIHINQDYLPIAFEKIYKSSGRYVFLSEYYNPTPIEVPYRGHSDKLFKRDFAGEFLDMYPDFRLLEYGFNYHRDHNFPQDDTTWFLLERR